MTEEAAQVVNIAKPVTGRLGMVTAMSLAAGTIPLPLLPERALRHIRGALAHEVVSRHGLVLSSDARDAMASPGTQDAMRDMLRKGVEMFARRILRRLGPLGQHGRTHLDHHPPPPRKPAPVAHESRISGWVSTISSKAASSLRVM